jgi:hypothetical protein
MLPNSNCVVKVGPGGRGFVIEHWVAPPPLPRHLRHIRQRRLISRRLIITAAHCLPKLPTPLSAAHTYEALVGKLGAKPDIRADCLFVDPIADVCVLDSPDDQVHVEDAEQFEKLTEEATTLRIGKAQNGTGYMLALDKPSWLPTPLRVFHGTWGSSLSTGPTEAGMSGSPILNHVGRVVGVVSLGCETVEDGVRLKQNARQPMLLRALPAWLLDRKV